MAYPKQPIIKTVDKATLDKLMDHPSIKTYTEKMTPDELNWYRSLLVFTGVYDLYVEEQKRKEARNNG